jgi:aspartate racemase
MSKIVGILGGMGPLATADLFTKIVQVTPAAVDQEHLRIIVDNHPQIASRVDFINGAGPDPLPQMVESARLLEKAGVDFIVMPCNTAHYWFDGIQAAVDTPMISIIAAAFEHVSRQSSGNPGRILLLAREVTVRIGLFQKAFSSSAISLVIPEPAEQELVERVVIGVKSGAVADNPWLAQFNAMIERYRRDGVTAVLAGCTELPLLFPFMGEGMQKYDTTMILAEKTVRIAKEV